MGNDVSDINHSPYLRPNHQKTHHPTPSSDEQIWGTQSLPGNIKKEAVPNSSGKRFREGKRKLKKNVDH